MTVNNNKRWSKEEVDFLKTNYREMPIETICDVLGRSLAGVKSKAITLEITRKKLPVIDGKKCCLKCETYKVFDDFYKHHNTKDGFYSWCKDCTNLSRRQKYFEKHFEEQEKMKKAFIKENKDKTFKCTRCKEILPLDSYRVAFRSNGRIERKTFCKACIAKKDRLRRLERERENDYAKFNA